MGAARGAAAPDATTAVTWTVRNQALRWSDCGRSWNGSPCGRCGAVTKAVLCGYALQRRLERDRVRCHVIATRRRATQGGPPTGRAETGGSVAAGLVDGPRRRTRGSNWPNHVSTALCHDAHIGVKVRRKRGCAARKSRLASVVCARAPPRRHVEGDIQFWWFRVAYDRGLGA